MRPLLRGSGAVTYYKVGLMVLKEHFKQRPIEATFSSFRSMVPLRTPSGAQHVESELEAELLEQLAFAPNVYDLLTQLIIEYTVKGKARRYTPDIAVQLAASSDYGPCRYLIEVKRLADLRANASRYAEKFQAGAMAAENMGATFRVMAEDRIRTPYLSNARLLRRHLAADPELEAFDIIRLELGAEPISVIDAISLLRQNGMDEPDIRAGIEQAVAWRMLLCDLARPFCDSTMIRARVPGEIPERNDDPMLKALYEADSQ